MEFVIVAQVRFLTGWILQHVRILDPRQADSETFSHLRIDGYLFLNFWIWEVWRIGIGDSCAFSKFGLMDFSKVTNLRVLPK